MAQRTKQRIQETFVTMLDQESWDKITVKDLVDRCGMNRNTFYYYYQDLYALLEELLQEEAERIIEAHYAVALWQEGFLDAIAFVLEHRRAAYHVFHSNARAYVVRYFLRLGDFILTDVVREMSTGLPVRPEDQRILVDFYKHALVGWPPIGWNRGMKEDLSAVIRRIGVLLEGNIRRALENGVTNDMQSATTCQM
ncbi:MAG: TetR-like C-terminal domain-containing protein [Oscillospiraceae bacterium]